MPRAINGTYTLPSTVNPVVPGTDITSDWANTTLADVAQSLTDSLARDGRGSMTAALKLFAGTQAAPGLTFALEPSTGIYRPAAGQIGMSILGVPTLLATAALFSLALPLTVAGNISVTGGGSHFVGDLTGDVTGDVTGNVSGSAGSISGIVAIANGGTGDDDVVGAKVNLEVWTGATGATKLSSGTTAQRSTALGVGARYNTDLSKFEGYTGAAWTPLGGGATGGGSDTVFWINGQTVNNDFTIGATENAGTFGDISIATGKTVTITTGGSWTAV